MDEDLDTEEENCSGDPPSREGVKAKAFRTDADTVAAAARRHKVAFITIVG